MSMNEEIRKFQKELNAGTTALVLLGVLEQAVKPMYGYQIAKYIETNSKGATSLNRAHYTRY